MSVADKQLNLLMMSTFMETVELTYEGIGKDMMIHRYPHHRRRRVLDQKSTQLPHRLKSPSHTLMQHRKDTSRKPISLPTSQTEINQTKEIPIRSRTWHRTIPFIQPGSPETKNPPPTPQPYRQKPLTQPQPDAACQPPIPDDLLELAHYINHLPRNPRGRRKRNTKPNNNNCDQNPSQPSSSPPTPLPSGKPSGKGFPSRNTLKRDPKLKGAIS
ncbi:hypothetical protein KC335_g11767, partial [Hortaea werneckii]